MSKEIKAEVGEFYVQRSNGWGNPVLFTSRDKSDAINFAIKALSEYSDRIVVMKCNNLVDDKIWSSED